MMLLAYAGHADITIGKLLKLVVGKVSRNCNSTVCILTNTNPVIAKLNVRDTKHGDHIRSKWQS